MTAARRRVLVVDDEPGLRDMLSIFFGRDGYDVTVAAGFVAAKEALQNTTRPYGLVLTDLMMPDGSGLDLLPLVKARWAGTEVIVMTAHGALDTAVEAMRRGAYDFITKPFATAELRAIAAKAFEKGQIVDENRRLRAQVEREHPTKDLLGHSEPMRQITDLLRRAASGRTTVLITGESGTGKELVAKALHANSRRACAAVRAGQLRRGHRDAPRERAVRPRTRRLHRRDQRAQGLLEEADGGTFFFDEIAETPLAFQAKLLRAIQEKEIRRVGENKAITVDVRIIAATNQDLLISVAPRSASARTSTTA